MINANDARKNAGTNVSHVTEVSHLLNHLEQIIRKASNQGKYTIDRQTFPEDRFKPETLAEVFETLKTNGYKVVSSKNNALQNISIDVSW